ncbi:MAG: hypothetical protein JWL96_2512 [Sphingomonas bacterium]|uniref:hypothetical protein n=1 Tax=Sphingomonas bacterium TaxID=1895847 RepID=UPI0026388DB3|nr:hypothetical protein [Sphingomonas bacterium]MDB5710442.1 hypothetical protein [Sphingomonas bacterium]
MNSKFATRALVALCLSAAALACAPAQAQTASYPKGAPEVPDLATLPDWDGLWERDQDNVWDNRLPVGEPQVPPYNAEWAEKAKAAPPGRRDSAGSPYNAMPGWMSLLFPLEIQVSRMQVTLLSENKGPRRIYTDGRARSENTLPSTTGHSIGTWRNGELFIETTDIRDDTRLPGGGLHSDEMTIKEHWYLRDYKTLVVDISVEDPKAFTKSWTTQKVFYRRADWEPVEYDRTENDRDAPPARGRPGEQPE